MNSLKKRKLTWYIILPTFTTAKARYSAGNHYHENNGYATNYQKQLQINLAVTPRKPCPALATNLGILTYYTLTIFITQITFSGCC